MLVLEVENGERLAVPTIVCAQVEDRADGGARLSVRTSAS